MENKITENEPRNKKLRCLVTISFRFETFAFSGISVKKDGGGGGRKKVSEFEINILKYM